MIWYRSMHVLKSRHGMSGLNLLPRFIFFYWVETSNSEIQGVTLRTEGWLNQSLISVIVPAKRCGRPRYGVWPYIRMILLHTALQGKVLAISSLVRYLKIMLNPSQQQNKCRYILLPWGVVFCSSTSDTLVHFLYYFLFRAFTFSACCLWPVYHHDLSCSRRRRSCGTSAPCVCCRSWELTKVGRRPPTFLLVLRCSAIIGQKLYTRVCLLWINSVLRTICFASAYSQFEQSNWLDP